MEVASELLGRIKIAVAQEYYANTVMRKVSNEIMKLKIVYN